MKWILFSFMFMMSSYAIDNIYKIAGKEMSFKKAKGLLVNDGCKKNCMALLKPFTIKKLPSHNGKNIKSKASLICEASKGKSIFGVDFQKNMMAFCLYSDGSLVEYRSLENIQIK